jgi:hypothetical protein
MLQPQYTPEEISARARTLYERDIRPKVDPLHRGKYLVIDIESGDYEIDEDRFAASERAAMKHPHGALFTMRIGERTMGRIGSRQRGDKSSSTAK